MAEVRERSKCARKRKGRGKILEDANESPKKSKTAPLKNQRDAAAAPRPRGPRRRRSQIAPAVERLIHTADSSRYTFSQL